MKENSVLRTLKFIFITVVLFVLSFSAVVVTVLNVYVPKYLATVKGKQVGYFTSPAEFDEVYEKLISEKKVDGVQVKVYLKDEPEFGLSYVRDSVVEEQNLYTNLREFVQADYTTYIVKVKGKAEMSFADKKEANAYATKLRGKIKKTVKVEVSKKVTDKLKITENASVKKIYSDLVSRYKPYYRTVSAGTYESLGAATYSYGKPPADLFQFISGGRRPTSGIVTQGFGLTSSIRGSTYRHTGIDIASNACPAIYPYKSGIVTRATNVRSYGYCVVISHGKDASGNEFSTLYAHLREGSIKVNVGDSVSSSTVIGTMGSTGRSTGIHLHFEMRITNQSGVRYYNPAFFI